MHLCPYCRRASFNTSDKLHRHISQSIICRDAHSLTQQSHAPPQDRSTYKPPIRPLIQRRVPDLPCAPHNPSKSGSRSSRPHPAVTGNSNHHAEDFTSKIIHFPTAAGTSLGPNATSFEQTLAFQKANNCEPWSPFSSQEEWEFARWIGKSGVSQQKVDQLLKSGMVNFRSCIHYYMSLTHIF